MIWKWALLLGSFAIAVDSQPTNSAIGRKIRDFTLADYRGKSYGLSDFSDARLVVVAFVGTECPLVRFYSRRLQDMADRYRPEDVQFLGIDSTTSRTAPVDVLVLAMMPHMHLRGKSFQYQARYPDGRTEILLNVPRYDFNWQTAYRLTVPKALPGGARVRCIAHYDNSENTLANPNPGKTVQWGDQTWDEMMIGYFDIAVPVNAHSRRR